MASEQGSGLGQGFMFQTAQQRAEYKRRKGKPGLPVDDPLTKLRDAYYASGGLGDRKLVSDDLLTKAEKHIARRISVMLSQKQTKVVKLQKSSLARWLEIISEEKKRRGLQ